MTALANFGCLNECGVVKADSNNEDASTWCPWCRHDSLVQMAVNVEAVS